MKLLIDMNLSPRWVGCLSEAKFNAVHWSAVGLPTALDHEIMSYARANGYVVLTNDLDFSAILAVTHGEKPSVVQLRSDDLNPDVIGNTVIDVLQQLSDDLAAGALVTVEPSQSTRRCQNFLTRGTCRQNSVCLGQP